MNHTQANDSLIDQTDQGICPDDHPCHLVIQSGRAYEARACDVDHPDHHARGETGTAPYVGMPLIRPSLTLLELETAAEYGADPELVAWARSYLSDQGRLDTGTLVIDGQPGSSVVGDPEIEGWDAGVARLDLEVLIHGGSRAQITIVVDGDAEHGDLPVYASTELMLDDMRALRDRLAAMIAERESLGDDGREPLEVYAGIETSLNA